MIIFAGMRGSQRKVIIFEDLTRTSHWLQEEDIIENIIFSTLNEKGICSKRRAVNDLSKKHKVSAQEKAAVSQ